TDVTQAGHLQQALDRAVLAERPVQDRQDHVHAGQHTGHRRHRGGRGRGGRPPPPRGPAAPPPPRPPRPRAPPPPGPRPPPAPAATEGSVRPLMASRSGSSLVSTHLPSGRMPTGTTS